MLGIFAPFLIAILTGLVALAYKNPNAYIKVRDKLNRGIFLCSIGASIFIYGGNLALKINRTEPNPEFFSEFQISVLQNPFISLMVLLGIGLILQTILIFGGYEIGKLKIDSKNT